MPYKLVWEDAPHDNNLPVLKNLPDGVAEDSLHRMFSRRKEARGRINGEYVTYHFCDRCEGWIPGDYYPARVNTLDSSRLAGRQGTEYYCRRCGYEVAFDGMVS